MSKAALSLSPTTKEEVEALLCEAVAAKNASYHRGGFSPVQLVLGANPRVPRSLLSDDALDLVGSEDVLGGTMQPDSAAAAFARRHQIREAARQALASLDAKSRLSEASRARGHSDKFFKPGEWVYVWRRVTAANRSHSLQRDRWTGPGVVVYQNGSTIWIAMRSKLYKCSEEQVRPATRQESLGAELLDTARFDQLREEVRAPGRRIGA
eukprot:2520496-Pyramimonas_sp.AAC.1